MRAIFLSLAVLCGSACADDMMARVGADYVRLTQEPCQPEVLKVIPQGHRGSFRRAIAVVAGKEYAGCWALGAGDLVVLHYADGDAGILPMAMFQRVPGA